MRRAVLPILAVLAAACGTSPPPRPTPTRGPARSVSAQPTERTPAARPAVRPVTNDVPDWMAELPSVTTRSRSHRIVLVRCAQEPRDGGPLLAVQLQVVPEDPRLIVRRTPTLVRRFVTADGTELTYPEQFPSVMHRSQTVAASLIDLGGRPHRALRDLEVDVHLMHVTGWALRALPPIEPGRHDDERLGPFHVTVTAEPEAVHVAFSQTDGSEAAWRAGGGRALPDGVHHDWAVGAVDVRDANGETLWSMFGGGSGGTSVAGFVPAPTTEEGVETGPVAYPVTISLRIPTAWRFEDATYSFQDVPLTEPTEPKAGPK